MAAQVNVYVPDEMKARMEGEGLNLSQLARAAWERELARKESGEAGEISVIGLDRGGVEVELRFEGVEILAERVYRKSDGAVVLVSPEVAYQVWSPEDLEQHPNQFADNVYQMVADYDEETLGGVLTELGVTPVIHL